MRDRLKFFIFLCLGPPRQRWADYLGGQNMDILIKIVTETGLIVDTILAIGIITLLYVALQED